MTRSKFVMPALQSHKRLTMPPDVRRAWSIHARQAGEVITACNDLHASCFDLFAILLDHPDDLSVPHAVWHSVRSDSDQREMLLALAGAIYAHNSPEYEEIKWLKRKAYKMASFRNDPAHTPISFTLIKVGKLRAVPNPFIAQEQRLKRLTDKPLHFNWKLIRDDMHLLARFVQYAALAVRFPGQSPWPRRPVLRSLPESDPKKGQTNPARGKPPLPP
jgi:hypothetical protein